MDSEASSSSDSCSTSSGKRKHEGTWYIGGSTSSDSAQSSNSRNESPLVIYRYGHLAVSDLVHTVWCEQQMDFILTSGEPWQSSICLKGKTMHKERDLEVNDYVSLDLASQEDGYAVQFLNLLSGLYEIQNQLTRTIREVPIFGLCENVLIMGKVDEFRVDYDDFTIDLIEFKTRKYKELPDQAHVMRHSVQLMLYKKLFDDLITRKVPYEAFTNIGLDLERELGKDIVQYIEHNLGFLIEFIGDSRWTLRFILEKIDMMAKFLPTVSRCFIDYTWQKDGNTFHLQEINYDEKWLIRTVSPCFSYWHGERGPRPVDIEDSWKCRICDYQRECPWRRKKQRRSREISYTN